MSDPRGEFSKFGFMKTFVLPALLIFLVPVLSLLFFMHAQGRFNQQARDAILEQIKADKSLSEEERANATALFTKIPFSRMVTHEEFAKTVNAETRFYFATFRWMIRLSALSILSSIAVFLLAGVCVLLSLRSAFVQYISLSAGWHVLRIFGALQTLAQGTMLVALSYWVTALWLNRFSVKLIIVAGLAAVVAVVVVIAAIFKKPKTDFSVEGQVIEKDAPMPLWDELRAICAKVGTDPPDQVIVGIDNNFFVTEQPVTVDGKTYPGRTLFVSLSLLKQLRSAEADAVLAHEMAHFSGQDTLYSKKITPLLIRYGNYLEALHAGGITRPIFHFMLCFRALYEVSLSRLSRQREFRADRIAVETTSPHDFTGALLRIVAYSKYRGTVEHDLFQQEQALETANVSERIEKGFQEYALCFASGTEIGKLATAHPFDSHPPLSQRFDAVGSQLSANDAQSLLAVTEHGSWYQKIHNAEQIEREQWAAFEERFRNYHEQTLPYRFLPETDEELAVVVKSFPEVRFEGKDGPLTIDHEKLAYANWLEPIRYCEATGFALNDGVLQINYAREGKQKQTIKMKVFAGNQQGVLDAINRYYARYQAAQEYQKQKKLNAESAAIAVEQ